MSFVGPVGRLAAACRTALIAALVLNPLHVTAGDAEKADGGLLKAKPHDVGPIFAKGNKSYFPMMLGNGIDNILIGYSGAMVVYYANLTFSLLTTIEALRGACQAGDLLGRKIDPRWRRLLPKLERGIEVNRFHGLIHEARSPKAVVTGSASQLGLFDVLLDKKTLMAQIERSSSREGFLTWSNHGYRAVPWTMCDASAALSRLGLEGAGRYVEMAARFTTTLNGFPEAVRPDGVYVKTWYPTVHGDFVHAVNLLLVRRHQDRVELFAGVPVHWGDASFNSLRVPLGLLVSASRTTKGVVAQVTNDSDRRQQFKVRASGTAAWEELVALNPGERVCLPRSR